jgi:GNAT superfamily N-acetyltransferase
VTAITADYVLRPIRADDFEALLTLAAASADTGRVRASVQYVVNPIEAAAVLQPEQEWVVAEGEDGLIGAAQVTVGDTEVEGDRHRCATLTSLMVHAAHRRRGVAAALTEWRLERAGPDAVVAATIQAGNAGSFANARRWATQIFGTLTLPVFRAGKAPSPPAGIEIREPDEEAEWACVAEGLATFERGWNLRTPETASTLSARSERAVSGVRVNRYFVAFENGEAVGGYALFEAARLQIVVVEEAPASLRALNRIVRVLPSSGELRQASLSRLWFAPWREEVGRALGAHARGAAAESGNALTTQYDARSPLNAVIPTRAWTPKTQVSVAVRSPVPLAEDHLLSPP